MAVPNRPVFPLLERLEQAPEWGRRLMTTLERLFTQLAYAVGQVQTRERQTATPAAPSATIHMREYVKDGKWVVQYNDAGTVRYKYLDLTGTGTTWTHSTTPP